MTFPRLMTGTAAVLAIAAAPMGAMAQATTAPSAPQAAQEAPVTPPTGDETAQSPDGAAPSMPGGVEVAEYSGEEIDAFAEAVIDVSEIRDQYAPQMQKAQNEQDQKAIVEEANAEMKAAIEAVDGISLDKYMAINRAATTDQDLNRKIVRRIQELTQNAG
ncbi:protein of unknown function [Poseidonocella pacifica]|uniref:DUF4168 domain-containing protein n=1 Tax=Poseidonocella pacifica TaxID=871651 RepID=A0A1I0WDK5_9RHOB|nr:DUF4168 domain-containing protein [Poseidonocella pacifica]SFA86835.1 protein of unknown function [Poseidonocella pacifica]